MQMPSGYRHSTEVGSRVSLRPTHSHNGYSPVKRKAPSSAVRAVQANTSIPQSLEKYKHLLFWCVAVLFL